MLSDRRILSLGATSMGQLGRTQKSQAASEKKLKTYACELEQKLEARTREFAEAREQQTATGEILRIISGSRTDVQPVFDTIVRNFASLCDSTFGAIYTFDGELVHFAGAYGFSPESA